MALDDREHVTGSESAADGLGSTAHVLAVNAPGAGRRHLYSIMKFAGFFYFSHFVCMGATPKCMSVCLHICAPQRPLDLLDPM